MHTLTREQMEEVFSKFKYVQNAHFGTDEGWDTLIYKLCCAIESRLDWDNHNDPNGGYITITDVKEKFGGLRFYYDDYSNSSEYISGLVTLAENMSEVTCERCGRPGIFRGELPWFKTLCDEHFVERIAGYNDYTKLLESEK
jgi:hypothetical protein